MTPPLVHGLLESGVPLRKLLDEIPVGLLVLDLRRRTMMINRALQALTGVSREQTPGLPCHHVLRGRLCLTGCPALRMNEDSEAVCEESDIISRDRQRIPVRVTVAPIKGENGRVVGFLESVEDLRAIRQMDARLHQAYRFSGIVGKSPQMERLFGMIPVVAQSDSSVLITGETGTGKDLVAEAIHHASERSKGSFVKVNCGALPETLLESELFGHQKGAFTGATESKPGRFRLAHNGTLFLTEIGDLPLGLQVKLLTFLDDKVIHPLGGTRGIQANVRIVAATHRNLEAMVREGRFRGDLLFRLNVVRLQLPPLRDRREDIRLLLDHFLHSFAAQFHKPIAGFSDKSLSILEAYPYPGNVRELRNIVEYAANFCQERQIQPRHLPAYLMDPVMPPAHETAPSLPAGSRISADPVEMMPVAPADALDITWSQVERRMIVDALVRAGGRKSRAAELLGWGRSTLWRKMKQHSLE